MTRAAAYPLRSPIIRTGQGHEVAQGMFLRVSQRHAGLAGLFRAARTGEVDERFGDRFKGGLTKSRQLRPNYRYSLVVCCYRRYLGGEFVEQVGRGNLMRQWLGRIDCGCRVQCSTVRAVASSGLPPNVKWRFLTCPPSGSLDNGKYKARLSADPEGWCFSDLGVAKAEARQG